MFLQKSAAEERIGDQTGVLVLLQRAAGLLQMVCKGFPSCLFVRSTIRGTIQKEGIYRVRVMARKGKPWFRQSKGTWYATVEGRKVSLGVRGEENEADAYRAWHRLMAGLREEKIKPKREPSVGMVIREFLADCEGRVKAKTLRIYRYFLKPFRTRHGKTKVSDLTPTLAEAYSRRRGWSESTRHAFLGTLATAFRWAVKAKLIAATPLADLELPPKASCGADAVVTPEDHASLVANATPAFSLFLRVLYATGARPGEVASITAENFDRAGPSGPSRSRRGRDLVARA